MGEPESDSMSTSVDRSEYLYKAIDALCEVTNNVVGATTSCQDDVQQVLRALTQVTLDGVSDVVLLARNKRGTGAIKIARSMLEVSLLAQYLEKNPAESIAYQDFACVLAWRWAQSSPGLYRPEQMRQAETEYNRVKARFTNSIGRGQNNWSVKSIKQMADEIGRADIYEVMYSAASARHHVNALGLLGHELDWTPEALRVAHGSLLQTLVSLYNVSSLSQFASRLTGLTRDFQDVWDRHVSER